MPLMILIMVGMLWYAAGFSMWLFSLMVLCGILMEIVVSK